MLFLPSNKTYGGIKKSIEIVMNVPKEELDLFIQLTNTIRDNQTHHNYRVDPDLNDIEVPGQNY